MNQYMDKTELAIADISGAELIKYYIMPDGLTGLLVIRGRIVFNYSSGEKYFNCLEQAAIRAYASCPDTAADDFTRDILEKRSGADLSPILKKYESIDGAYEKNLPFEKDTVCTFRKMIEYYLEMIYAKIGSETIFPAEIKGYRRKYSLNFRLNGERKTIPFSYMENGSSFEMAFGNIIEASDSLKLLVKYSFGMISVTADLRCKKNMRIEDIFDMFEKREILRIYDETEMVYNDSKAIESMSCEIPEKIKMICDPEEFELLRLPFGNAFFFDSDQKTVMIVSQKNRNDTTALLYQSQREYLSYDKNIVTDSFNAVHEVFCSDGITKICTRFLPSDSFSRGIFKQKYENRYFYRSIDDIGGE